MVKMKKFLSFSKHQPGLARGINHRASITNKQLRRVSGLSQIQIVRGAYNIDLTKVDRSFTKLHRACLLNDETLVKKHIVKTDVNSQDTSHRYPVHLACVNGNFSIVKHLVEHGASLNVQDNDGCTPLIKAIECGHEHLVKYLLDWGADPNICDLNRCTALHWALMTESMIATDALISSDYCDLSVRNCKDETCLHLAVRCPRVNAFTIGHLISNCDIEARDQLGLRAYDIALACDNRAALDAFAVLMKKDLLNDDTKNQVQDTKPKEVCDECKSKLPARIKQNADYERRIVQLVTKIATIKLDMATLEDANAKLVAENTDLKRVEPDESCSDFIVTKAHLQDRIDKLKSELTKMIN